MAQTHAEIRIIYLNPRDLLPSRSNVRSDPGDLAGLAETIREHGILQPLGVTLEGDTHRVVYGNRRREAAIVVGMDRVPCILVQVDDDDDIVVQQVLENLQRLDLNDLDKSRAFERLAKHLEGQEGSRTEALEAMARTLGLSSRQIQRYLRLRQLSPVVQQFIAQGEMGVTHGQHLVDIKPMARQEALAEIVVEESLSAAELSRVCAALQHNANIDPERALEMMRRGERVPVVEVHTSEPIPRFGAGPGPKEAQETDSDDLDQGGDDQAPPWETGPKPEFDAPYGGDQSGSGSDFAALQPKTRDGNRVLRIHSLDSFMDELQRLTQCIQDGDLQQFLGEDAAGLVKLGLAARQLKFLSDAVSALAKASGAKL